MRSYLLLVIGLVAVGFAALAATGGLGRPRLAGMAGRTRRKLVILLVVLAFLGVTQAALEAAFPIDALIIAATAVVLGRMFADYFRPSR